MKILLGDRRLTLRRLAEACGGTIVCRGGDLADQPVSGICTDSREAGAGDLFVAIRGARVDGHDFFPQVLGQGCPFLLGSREPDDGEAAGKPYAMILTDDPVEALGRMARDHRARGGYPCVAVTGSVGKTTTKEFLVAVLREGLCVHKSQGNHNSQIGLPLSMLSADPHTEVSVLEMGMSAAGEIERLSMIAEPDIACITNIGTSHLESLGSRENICAAKLEITRGMKPGGVLFLNGDEPLLRALRGGRLAPRYVALEDPMADYRAVNIRQSLGKTVFDLIAGRRVVTNLEIPVMGRHNVYAALFAFAVAQELGLSDAAIRRGLGAYQPPEMRQQIYDLAGVTVLEDCYNAAPESVRAAALVLDDLAALRGGSRKVAVLGDMRELGEGTVELHRQVGRYLAEHGFALLCTFGPLASHIAEGARAGGLPEGAILENEDLSDPGRTVDFLRAQLRPGDLLLVKGSRAVQAERIPAGLRAAASPTD